MKINKTLDVPREFIFDKIIDSCLYDIEKQTGHRPKLNQLKGFHYTKKFRSNQSGTIKFDEIDGPAIYAFTTATDKRTYHTRWELHKIDNRTTNVVISETQDANGFFQLINDTIVNFAFSRIKKRQLNATLDAIGKSYNG